MRVDIKIQQGFENFSKEVRIFQNESAEEFGLIALKITDFSGMKCEPDTKLTEVMTIFNRKAFLEFIQYLLQAAEKMK